MTGIASAHPVIFSSDDHCSDEGELDPVRRLRRFVPWQPEGEPACDSTN